MDLPVKENAARRRFELALPGNAKAVAYYRIDEHGHIVLIHTDVPEGLEGQGLDVQLAMGTLDLIRRSGRKVVLKCPFMSGFVQAHVEYADLVAG